ncbi:MAG: hypothetical protein E7299_10880 [Lachnospiraceae bacterium]|nr:hypothetical protein [Lachnospiraceae bacterium]
MDTGIQKEQENNFIPLKKECVEAEAADTSEKELKALKLWLFSENIRVETEKKKLQEMQNKYLKERVQFQEEMRLLNAKISASQQRLKQDEMFFEKKMQILKSGFAQLDLDRQAFEKEREQERRRRRRQMEEEDYRSSVSTMEVSILFAGVKNALALKKRYKDLLKIFHPDNIAGDKAVVQEINKEYERLKREL